MDGPEPLGDVGQRRVEAFGDVGAAGLAGFESFEDRPCVVAEAVAELDGVVAGKQGTPVAGLDGVGEFGVDELHGAAQVAQDVAQVAVMGLVQDLDQLLGCGGGGMGSWMAMNW